MKEHVYEVLEKINNAKTIKERKALLTEYGAKHPYNLILSMNFDKTLELDLPEGPPPYKRDETLHPDLFGTSLAQVIRRLSSLFKTSTVKVPKIKREHIFIQMLESIPPKEADVLVFAKDKALEELYPNITRKLVAEVFPNYCRE